MIDSTLNSSTSSVDGNRTVLAGCSSVLANDAVDVGVDRAGVDEILEVAVAA